MPHLTDEPPVDDPLDDVINAYLEARQAGRDPDRRELLQAHPALADDLERFFAAHDEMDRLARPLRDVADGGPGRGAAVGRRRPGPAPADPGRVRRLRPAGGPGRGRDGDRLPGPPPCPEPRRGAQADPRRTAGQRVRRAAVPQRGRGRGAARAPEHRADPRRRRAPGPALPDHEPDRRGQPGRRLGPIPRRPPRRRAVDDGRRRCGPSRPSSAASSIAT